MRWTVKFKLLFSDSKNRMSNIKMVVLILSAIFMVCLNWTQQTFETRRKDNSNDFLSCSQDGREVITKSSVREIGQPISKKGIPTIQRIFNNKSAIYLIKTLNSLFNSDITDEDLSNLLIVIFLADTKASAREQVKTLLRSNFGQYLERNLIHVIVAPPSFYPQLEGLERTLNDGQERMYWRSKQSMDYVFMFYYCQGLSQYYLHLEDDVISEPGYMKQIRHFIDLKGNTQWDVLWYSKWGFIGKLFHDKDLRNFGRFVTEFYSDMPVDWLLYFYINLRAGKQSRDDAIWKTELFHHIGKQSSSLGT